MERTELESNRLSNIQTAFLVILRIFIGWHILYEGVAKILIPDWTSAGYLENSQWIFSGIFHWMAANAVVLKIVDLLNIWGLTLIGIGLLFGIFARYASISGIALLSFYYIANPPFIGANFGIPVEGHYLFVNKTLIELVALSVIAVFPIRYSLGVDRFLINFIKRRKNAAPAETKQKEDKLVLENMKRREMLTSLATIPVLGAFIYGTVRKYNYEKINAITGASIKVSNSRLKDMKGELPKGTIGNHQLSRLMLGGNLIGGWAHSRDLIYVSSLFKAYNTDRKVLETLMIADQAGINAMNISDSQLKLINKYQRIIGSNIKTICQIHPVVDDIRSHVDKVIDNGGDIIQIQGSCCDWRVRDGEIDVLQECIEYTQKQGYTIGMGAHSVQALIQCEKAGITPDFYMKTLHHDKYWSAHPKKNRIPYSVDTNRSPNHDEFHDNMFCLFPDETVDFIKNSNIPVIGFKVLAGGAIQPKDGFKFAFENGADYICVGMFDYQIIDDVNITLDSLSQTAQRERKWY
jgi:uncharacterized membrane protein YphA (DoxX/SURF4 family)